MDQRFIAHFHHSDPLPNFETTGQLAYIAQITADDQRYFRCAHVHPEVVEVSFILTGESTYFIDHQSYPVHAGDIVIVNQQTVHEEGWLLPSLHVGLQHVQTPTLPTGHLIEPTASPIIHTRCFSMLADLAIMAYNLLNRADDLQMNLANQLTTELMLPILTSLLVPQAGIVQPKKHTESAAAMRIKTFIDTEYATIPNLAFMATQLQMSPSYIDHQFGDNYYRSPSNYLQSRRIGEAQQALINLPNRAITTIAYDVGFRSLSRFNHVFKNLVGTTPLKFRQAYHQPA